MQMHSIEENGAWGALITLILPSRIFNNPDSHNNTTPLLLESGTGFSLSGLDRRQLRLDTHKLKSIARKSC